MLETTPIATAPAHDDVSVIRPDQAVAQHRAARLTRTDLPWLSSVKLSWGPEVSLLNISNSGMLVETSSKFTPGSVTKFQLCGSDDTLVVPARFVRSEVATVDGRGVRYRAAAVFEKALDLGESRERPAQPPSTSYRLAQWLLGISSALARGADHAALRHEIAEGLRALLSAREVELREAPIAPPATCESVYFTVTKGSGAHVVLQATFEPSHAPTELEFKLLQTGAALAAVLEGLD